MIKTIQNIINEAFRTGRVLQKNRESLDWLARRVRNMRYSPSSFVREKGQKFAKTIRFGRMYTYFYDPKYKFELPYFDRFPCIFVIDADKDGFLGLNLHYLDYKSRAELLDALFKLENNARIPSRKKLEISYGIISSFSKSKLAAPCIKRYLHGHVRSRFIEIDPDEWHIVAMLPLQTFDSYDKTGKNFRKYSASAVWKDSRRKAR